MANRKGISNVIATIILIAVAIALAVAVAIWAFGLLRSGTHAGTLSSVSQNLYVINGVGYLVYTCTGSYTPGVQYSGTIYLSSGSNIPFTVVAQAIS